MSALKYSEQLKTHVRVDASDILKQEVVSVGKRFRSADSYSFLVRTSTGNQYVAKLFKYPHWPPKGKLELISDLLIKHSVVHEEIVYINHSHQYFKNGWLISTYIAGGNAMERIEDNEITWDEYYVEAGKLFQQSHQVTLNKYGSVHDSTTQFDSYGDYLLQVVRDRDFSGLKSEYREEYDIIQSGIDRVRQLVDTCSFEKPVLVHTDMGPRNVMWNEGSPILIDWVDSIAGPRSVDFATPTYRKDRDVLSQIEKGYGAKINRDELYLHQIMRFIYMIHFDYFEDKDMEDFGLLTKRLQKLLEKDVPYGV